MSKNRKANTPAKAPTNVVELAEADALEGVRAAVEATGTNPGAAASLTNEAAEALDAGAAEAANPTPLAGTPTGVTVALRGGLAVRRIALTGKPYRTAASHNRQWWEALTAALAAGPADVAPLLVSQANPHGVPAHFVGYTLRRGYLKAAE